jgi:hypothetical protein
MASVYTPVAIYCCVALTCMKSFAGATTIAVNWAVPTVKPVDPVIVLPEDKVELAVTVVVPIESASAKPILTGATVGIEELHVTEAVISCMLWSVYVPVAASCSVTPKGIVELAGVMAMDTRTAAVTVSVAEPETDEEKTAPMLAVPGVKPCAMPSFPAALLTVATAGADEVQ